MTKDGKAVERGVLVAIQMQTKRGANEEEELNVSEDDGRSWIGRVELAKTQEEEHGTPKRGRHPCGIRSNWHADRGRCSRGVGRGSAI